MGRRAQPGHLWATAPEKKEIRQTIHSKHMCSLTLLSSLLSLLLKVENYSVRSSYGSNNGCVTEDGIVDVGGTPPGVCCSGKEGNACLDEAVGDGESRRRYDKKVGEKVGDTIPKTGDPPPEGRVMRELEVLDIAAAAAIDRVVIVYVYVVFEVECMPEMVGWEPGNRAWFCGVFPRTIEWILVWTLI